MDGSKLISHGPTTRNLLCVVQSKRTQTRRDGVPGCPSINHKLPVCSRRWSHAAGRGMKAGSMHRTVASGFWVQHPGMVTCQISTNACRAGCSESKRIRLTTTIRKPIEILQRTPEAWSMLWLQCRPTSNASPTAQSGHSHEKLRQDDCSSGVASHADSRLALVGGNRRIPSMVSWVVSEMHASVCGRCGRPGLASGLWLGPQSLPDASCRAAVSGAADCLQAAMASLIQCARSAKTRTGTRPAGTAQANCSGLDFSGRTAELPCPLAHRR